LPDLSLNDSGSRGAQKITLSIRPSPTNGESKLNEVYYLLAYSILAYVPLISE